MQIGTAEALGQYLRDRRRAAGLTQSDLATRAQVSRRWLSDLESGKPTAEIGLVFRVVSALGLFIDLRSVAPPDIDLDAYLDGLGTAP